MFWHQHQPSILIGPRAPAGSSQPVIVAVGVVLGLILCVSCLLAGVWWKRRYSLAIVPLCNTALFITLLWSAHVLYIQSDLELMTCYSYR